MSKIQEALRILQKGQPETHSKPDVEALIRARRGFDETDGSQSAIPIAKKKRIETDGAKHKVSQENLLAVGLLAPMDHAVAVADEFRRIKRPVIKNAMEASDNEHGHMNVVMIASAMPRAGKTFCSVNLAVSMSLERELNVLLVDADVAKPQISREFGLQENPGLIDLLIDETLPIEEVLVRTDLNDVVVLPAGHSHPQATELLASDRMEQVVDELARRYPDRIILVDSPPLLITTEAQALGSQVGQIALVVEAGATSHQALSQAIETLDPSKAINIILNKSRHLSPRNEYGGNYGYYGYEGS